MDGTERHLLVISVLLSVLQRRLPCIVSASLDLHRQLLRLCFTLAILGSVGFLQLSATQRQRQQTIDPEQLEQQIYSYHTTQFT